MIFLFERTKATVDGGGGSLSGFVLEWVGFARASDSDTPVFLFRPFFFFFCSHSYFPAPGQAVATGRCRPFSLRLLPSIFIAHTRVQQSHCSSIFHRVFANLRSRAFRKSICAREKVPARIFYEHALGGARTHETDLYQARG